MRFGIFCTKLMYFFVILKFLLLVQVKVNIFMQKVYLLVSIDSDSELSEVVESHALNGLCHFPSLGLYIKLVEVSSPVSSTASTLTLFIFFPSILIQ